MILRRLHVQRFLGLRDASFEFARGINVIVGPNEAGKSTLRAAIHAVLYGNPVTASANIRDAHTSWGTDDPPQLDLEFELDGRVFRLTKDFFRRAIILADEAGRTYEQHKMVQERLGIALGLATKELFEATAHVAQAELELIHFQSVAKGLGRLLSGVGEDVSVAIRRLESRVAAMERGIKGYLTVRSPGILRAQSDRVGELQKKVDHLRRSAANLERKQVAHAEAAATTKRLAEELKAKSTLLEVNRRILREEERLRALVREEKMLEERIKNVAENLHKLDAIDQGLEATTAAGVPDADAVQTLRALQGRISGLEAQTARLRRMLQEPPPESPTGVGGLGWALIVIGALGALLGLFLAFRGGTAPGLGVLLAGAIAVFGGWWTLFRIADARRQFEFRQADRAATLEALEGEVAEAKASLSAHVVACGAASPADLEVRYAHYQGLIRDRKQVAAFLEELRGGSSDEDLDERWKAVRREIFAVQEQLRNPEIADKRLTALQVPVLEQEVARLSQDLAQIQEQERRLSFEVETLADDAEVLPAAEEQLQAAQDALESVRTRHAVYRAALDGLEKAKQLAEVPARTVMEDRASDYLRLLSNGRYARLRVSEDNLDITVYSEEAGNWVAAQEPFLSRGTVDLVYLSARLALVHVLAGTKQPPLLFDDPFVTLDERRRGAVADLLRKVSETYQVFLFTCSSEYRDCADRIIELGGTALEPAEAEEARRIPVPSVGPLWDRLG